MEININKNYNLDRLQQWLNYELSISVLFIISWFWGIAIFLMIIAALIFTPLLIKVLLEEKKYGWMITFFILVIIPTIGLLVIDINTGYKFIAGLVVLALFYFYCFTLKLVIRDWKEYPI